MPKSQKNPERHRFILLGLVRVFKIINELQKRESENDNLTPDKDPHYHGSENTYKGGNEKAAPDVKKQEKWQEITDKYFDIIDDVYGDIIEEEVFEEEMNELCDRLSRICITDE